MSKHNAALALKAEDRPGKPQERMTADEYRKAVGAPAKKAVVPRALPEPTPQDMVAMVAATWPAVDRLTIELPTPPGLNNAYANAVGRGRFKTPKAKQFEADATAILAGLNQKLKPETYRAHIVITRESPLADIDGRAKLILDVLAACGITADDKNCEKLEIEWRYRHPPGATVMLSRYAKRRAAA